MSAFIFHSSSTQSRQLKLKIHINKDSIADLFDHRRVSNVDVEHASVMRGISMTCILYVFIGFFLT